MTHVEEPSGKNQNPKHPYPSVVERYFRRGFKIDMKGGPCEDFCILKHSNRVCLLTIAASHPIIRDGKTVTSVDFQVTSKMNRLDNKVSGKSKKGGQWLNPSSPLCCVSCDDDSKYTMYSCIRGKLAEVNRKLQTTPNLLKLKYETDGYIAIILPKIMETEKQIESLLTDEQYEEAIKNRTISNENAAVEHGTDNDVEMNSDTDS